MSEANTTGPSPICALHPAVAATNVCERCGNFMCDECSQSRTQTRCPKCRELAGATPGFPFNRENASFDGLISHAWTSFKREWGMLTVSVLVLFAASIGISLFGQLAQSIASQAKSIPAVVITSLIFTFAQMLVQGAMVMGLIAMTIDVLGGGRAEVSRLFSQFTKVGRYLLQVLIVLVLVGVPIGVYAGIVGGIVYVTEAYRHEATLVLICVAAGLLLLPPLIYVSLGLFFAQAELANNDDASAWEAMRASWVMARGKRLFIFGVSLVTGLIVMAGLVVCCVGVLASVGLGQLVTSGLYLALRDGSGLLPVRRSQA